MYSQMPSENLIVENIMVVFSGKRFPANGRWQLVSIFELLFLLRGLPIKGESWENLRYNEIGKT